MDARSRVLRGELHEVVATFDMVIQTGNAHTELIGDRLHRDPVETDLVRRVGNHVAVELGRTPGLPPGLVPHSRRSLCSAGHATSPRMPAPPWVRSVLPGCPGDFRISRLGSALD